MNNIKKEISIICFGEVLFDVFPTHKKIGGAPLNVAFRLSSLGINTQIISRIGNDEIGTELLAFIQINGVNPAFVQSDSHLETGQVIVRLDDKGSASYTIKHPVAWDKIQCNPEIENAVKKSACICLRQPCLQGFNLLQHLVSINKLCQVQNI